LLTAARLYLDSLPQHAARILTDERLREVRNAPSIAYDSSLAYRVMEALRNYSQHEALPVHNWLVDARWDENVEPRRHGFSAEPALDLDALSHSRRFKKSVLRDLAENPETLKLKPHVREYIGLLSSVQAKFRSVTAKSCDHWKQYIASAQVAFVGKCGELPVGLVVVPIDEHGHIDGVPVNLSSGVMNYLDYLQRRTGEMVKYSQRCVVY
jgi:hypothetical protein